MPRTFKATIVLIVTIGLLAVVTIINVFQTNATEETVRDLQQKVDALSATNSEILQKLESGVAVAGGAASSSGGASDGKYAAALNDPDNILSKQTDLMVPANAKMGGTLRRTLRDTPKGYNWLTENSVDVANLQFIVHSTYARRDFNNPDNYVGDLAYKVTVNDDFTEYVVHLKEGVYWHVPNVDFSEPKNEWLKEPRELTAEDAVFFFEMIKNDQVEAGSLKNYYEDMEKAEVVDKYTFKVTWSKKVYHSMDMTIGYYPLPKWIFTKDEEGNDLPEETLGLKFNNHWASKLALGTGPYRLLESKAGERVVLERNDRYFGKTFPFDRIEFQIVKDPEAAFLKLKADEVDFTGIPPTRYKSEIKEANPNSPFKKGDLEYRIVDRFAYYYLGWNADNPLFADKKVRLAMTHALNRPGIVQQVFNGLGTIQTGPYYYKHPAMDPSVQPYGFDLEKAKTLLDEAGWRDTDGDGIRDKMVNGEMKKFEFTVLAYDSPAWRSSLSVFKEDLRKIGIQMSPQVVDWPTMQKKMDEKKFDAFTGGWGLSWLIDPYQIWHSSQADTPKGSNRVGFRNKRADEIIDTLRVTFDDDERIKLLREFHRIVHAEQPYTFFFSPQDVVAWQPRLENVVINTTRPQFTPLPWYIDPDVKKAPAKK
jgi:ABC-type transport system substrate-binding protein